MKFTVMFKTPDAPDDAIREAGLVGAEFNKANQVCQRFFEYGEYAYIEIDTKKGTATVLPTKN
jgi:hypothetical protein